MTRLRGVVAAALVLATVGLGIPAAGAEVAWPPTPTPISGSGVDASNPQVAGVGGNAAVSVWETCTCTGGDVEAAYFDGHNWTPPVIISSTAPGAEGFEPKVSATSPGHAVAVWTADDGLGTITIEAATFDGATWSAPVVISALTAVDAHVPAVAGRADGSAVAAWVSDDGTDITVEAALFDGATWAPATAPLSDPIAGEPDLPQVATTGPATAVVVWQVGSCLCLGGYIEANTLTGATPLPLPLLLSNPADDSSFPVVAGTADGGVVAAWTAFTFAGPIVIQASRFDGTIWTQTPDVSDPAEIVLAFPFGPPVAPQAITSTEPGSVTVSWVGVIGGSDAIVHASKFAGGSWTAPANLSPPGGGLVIYFFVDITTVDPGVALAVWAASDNSNFSIQSSIYDGTTATPAINVAPTSIYTEAPQTSGAGDGTAVTVWIDGSGVSFIVLGAQGAPTSRTKAVPGGSATLTTSAGGILNMRAVPVPSSPPPPASLTFPYGLLTFEIVNILPGSTVTLTLNLPGTAQQYWKVQNGAWFRVDTATITGNQVVFTLTDGGLGDADGVANGIIVDPSGAADARVSFTG